MPTTRRGSFELQNFTTQINKMPRMWSKINDMGIFDRVMNETRNITVDVVTDVFDTFQDTRPGGARNKANFESVQEQSFIIPFFSLDSRLSARDIQDLRSYGSPNGVMTVNEARLRIMNRIQKAHMALREKVMMEAIIGRNYRPGNTTPAYDYYTVYGQTRKTVDFEFSSSSEDVLGKIDEIRAQIRNFSQNSSQTFEIVVLCSSSWFDNFINHNQVRGAYTEYSSNTGSRIDPNRDRPGMDDLNRSFIFQNIRFMEYDARFGPTAGSQTPLIPDGEAYAFPIGVDNMFEIQYGPGDLIDEANTIAQEMYMIEVRDHRTVEIESDTAMIGLNHRPELVVQLTDS